MWPTSQRAGAKRFENLSPYLKFCEYQFGFVIKINKSFKFTPMSFVPRIISWQVEIIQPNFCFSSLVISLLKKIGFKEMKIQKFGSFVITKLVKGGIHYTSCLSDMYFFPCYVCKHTKIVFTI